MEKDKEERVRELMRGEGRKQGGCGRAANGSRGGMKGDGY